MNTTRDTKLIVGLFQKSPALPSVAPRLPRVWLVDDDRRFRELLGSLLDQTDAVECEQGFSSGELLLSALARETPPESILLDVHLHDRNGIDFIPAIKALAPGTRVLILTTFFDSELANRAARAGAAGFLVKSAPLEEILGWILDQETTPGSRVRV